MNTTTDMIAVNCFVFEVNQTLQAQNDNECVFDFKQDAQVIIQDNLKLLTKEVVEFKTGNNMDA